MASITLWIIGLTGIGTLVISAIWWLAGRKQRQINRALQNFHQQREIAEAHFVKRASQSGKPRGLTWVDVDFDNDVSLARDRTSGRLLSFVAIKIQFEAVEGGEMEDNENVGYIRSGTAVFKFDGQQWDADGRAIMNLSPDETIERFQSEVDRVAG